MAYDFRQFYFNRTIPILNDTDTETQIKRRLMEISGSFEDMIQITYFNMNFLSNDYISKFYTNLNENITSLVTGGFNSTSFLGTLNFGFKSVIVRYFEMIRFLGIEFFSTPDYDYLNAQELGEANSIIRNVIRPWYSNLLALLITSFSDYIAHINLINVSTFIVLLVVIIILYCLVWKNYEQKLKDMLKTSVDLINLLPDEIKCLLVVKLNEEEEKKES